MDRYVNECNLYQMIKNRTKTPMEKLMTNKVPNKLWTYLTVDFIMKLLLVAEKDVILVVCDRFLKIAYFVATTEKTAAKGLARLFRDNIYKLYRLLESVILYKRPQFVVELTKELNRILEIRIKLSIVFHLQTNE